MMKLSVVAVAALVAASSAHAQVSLSAGALAGSFNCWQSLSCNAHEAAEARNGVGGFLAASLPLASWVRAGAELTLRHKDLGYKESRLTSASVELQLRPTPLNGLWLRAASGVGTSRESAHQVDDIVMGAESRGVRINTIGALYELRIADRVSLVPRGTVGWIGREQRLWDVGVGVTLAPALRAR